MSNHNHKIVIGNIINSNGGAKITLLITMLAIIGLAVVLGRISYLVNPINNEINLPQGVNLVTVRQLEGLEKPLWVDARSAEEYEAGHIEGSVNVSMEGWTEGFAEFARRWRPGKSVAVYCSGGACRSSADVAKRLKEALPELKIYILKEGYPEYLEETKGNK